MKIMWGRGEWGPQRTYREVGEGAGLFDLALN